MADNGTNPNTIKFNVRGTILEVSRSLIEQNAETLLGRMVSDVWLNDRSRPVFVDGDAQIFNQVINYLHYGSITLPPTIPMDMFLRDLDFYGIIPTEGSVKPCSEWARDVRDRAKQAEELLLENSIECLAAYCATKIAQHPSAGYVVLTSPSNGSRYTSEEKKEQGLLWDVAKQVGNSPHIKDKFQMALSRYGMRLEKPAETRFSKIEFRLGLL